MYLSTFTTPLPSEDMSVHLSEFPKASSYEQKLLDETDQVRNIVTMALRINEKIRPFFCRTAKKQLNIPEPNPDEKIVSYMKWIH